jgi:hypothetical protein
MLPRHAGEMKRRQLILRTRQSSKSPMDQSPFKALSKIRKPRQETWMWLIAASSIFLFGYNNQLRIILKGAPSRAEQQVLGVLQIRTVGFLRLSKVEDQSSSSSDHSSWSPQFSDPDAPPVSLVPASLPPSLKASALPPNDSNRLEMT